MVDRLLAQLNREGLHTYGNNDNMASLITGKFPNTVSRAPAKVSEHNIKLVQD
jgi:hypothetical protein